MERKEYRRYPREFKLEAVRLAAIGDRRPAEGANCFRRFRVTTDSRNTKASPNLLDRQFEVGHPNACWLADFTYIATREGWLYLAGALDLRSRAIVGWAMGKTLDVRLAQSALDMAIRRQGRAPMLPSPPATNHRLAPELSLSIIARMACICTPF